MTAPSPPSLEQLSGLVERVTFHNADSGFCVLRLKVRGERDLVTLVGHAPSVTPGEYALASGSWVTDREHGRQFKAVFVKIAPPNTLSGIERYLGSGMVKGIGPVYASRLASAFGTGVFEVIEQTPERLREIDGIGEKRARKITSGWADQFKTAEGLRELYPRLLSHSTLCFGAKEVMNFLGRKLVGNFRAEVVSDLSSLACRRVGGSRIKHRVKQNWLKMYDKAGLVLRIETVINNPEEFRVRKQVLRDGKQRAEWVQLRKGVAYLFRYREVSLQANARYLDALAAVDDPTKGQAGAAAPDHRKKGCRGPLLPGVLSDGATRRRSVREPDGR